MDEEKIVYEIGYHLAPSGGEDAVQSVSEKLKKAIAENGGIILSEELPKLAALAYDIKGVGKAYFGWIKFEMEPRLVVAFDAFVKQQKDILRFLIVKTDKENNIHYHKISEPQALEEIIPEAKKTSVEEIDKSIEDLVIN